MARSLGESRYAQVTRSLMESLSAGRYAVGELLPPESDLCRQLGVSRTTVREAMRALKDRGMVLPKAGIGTLVLATQPSTRYVHAVDSISDVFQYAKNSRNPVLVGSEECDVDESEAELLRCAPGQRWLLLEMTRTFRGNKSPILFARVYVPLVYASIAKLVPRRSDPVYTLLESEFGVEVLSVEQEFKSVRLDARTAKLLHVKSGTPGLCVIRHYLGGGDRLLLVTVSSYRADQYSYKMKLRFNPQHVART
jgi:GntR family transcriptional regulator